MADEEWKAGMELKLGARRLTIRAWDALKQAEGSVVFMSGSAALDPKPAFAAPKYLRSRERHANRGWKSWVQTVLAKATTARGRCSLPVPRIRQSRTLPLQGTQIYYLNECGNDLAPTEGWSDRSQNCLNDMRIVGNT